MAGMVSRLTALETADAAEHSKPGDLAGPKPNALRTDPLEEPIPPLPGSLRGYPTPWVTEYDVLSYVYPLYTRGWGQSLNLWKVPPPKDAPPSSEDIENRQLDRYTMLLSARYRFQDYDSAASFFLKVASVAKSEDHHPSLHIEPGSPCTVTVTTQTHSARRPKWPEEAVPRPPRPPPREAPKTEESPPADVPKLASRRPALPSPTRIPGITLRDVRLAILVEEIYSIHFSSHLAALGRHIHSPNFRLSWFTMERIWKRQILLPGRETGRRERRRLFVERMMRGRFAGKAERGAQRRGEIRCYACRGDHHLGDCTKREHIVPRNACHYCNGMHWAVDCPVRNEKSIRRWQFQPDIVQ
ncbi:hypothetical protein AX14_013448 [Amanita brunnescens Koide BX004]|nr:hypothetical protein AX14_013448 [Amanita brunnescens Koide BX004]